MAPARRPADTSATKGAFSLELWGGHECTVNRVGDRYRDQTRLTGHEDRDDDIAAFAALGITALRYPVLWERVAPERADEPDWRWSDRRLAAIARAGMRPIVGLLHHGSGPRYTSLTEDEFADAFTAYAGAVARRYPAVAEWTPINEPLTTARFSTLYGHWYPHAHDEALFWRALLNQVDATRGAMQAIRAVNPAARLIQTEDLGEYYSTPEVAESAAHLNERRWATWDLLAGRVTRDHRLWDYLDRFGLSERLRAIADDPCPPDAIGVNYYPTSERFLDQRLDAYSLPRPATGYHDLTAARVLQPPTDGLAGLIRQVWDRYGLPLAVTESHLGCTREEQARWLWQAWRTAAALKAEGVNVRAVTAWALLGNMDWNSLLVDEAGRYEPGAFDVSGGGRRPTAVARLIATIGTGAPLTPALAATVEGPGWWQRDVRLEHPPHVWREPTHVIDGPAGPLIAIAGATGTLGQALAGGCRLRGLAHLLADRATLPIDDPVRVAAFLDRHRPWAVINAAGWVRVDEAEADAAGCDRANAHGAAVLARACAERGVAHVVFSSDLVFDGARETPYLEGHATRPLGVYGRSKVVAECAVLDAGGLAIRTAAFFSPYDPHNFAMAVERVLHEGGEFRASDAHRVSPTYVPDLVRATLDLLIDGESGLWHLANEGAVSWWAFGRIIAAALGLDPARVVAVGPAELGWRAPRPAQAALGSRRGRLMPPLADAVARHAAIRRGHGSPFSH